MNDPYSVLRVSPSASDAEVKKAYRDLARKYHPDNYHDNPLADLAQEKMKEINEAYDTIMKSRSGSRSGGAGAGGYGAQGGYYGQSAYSGASSDPAFSQVRSYINAGRLDEAERMLNANISNRSAEWYFLRGEIAYRRGWIDEARQNYQIACNMAPNNMEYQRALSVVRGGSTPYRQADYGAQSDMDTACDICNTLLCLNCLCNSGGCR